MSGAEPQAPLCFVDTNIWLYAFVSGPDAAKSDLARQLLRDSEETLVASSQVINEVCVNLLKKAHVPETEIRELIRSFYRKYRVVLLDQEVEIGASELRERFSLSFWDSLIVSAAVHGDAAVLYSEDLQAGLRIDGRLVVCNPFLP